MDPHQLLSPKQRLVRGVGGLALIGLCVVLFLVSDAVDPQNRGAVLSIVALIVGISLLGQAIRGAHDGPLHRESPPATGRPVPAVTRMRGLVLAWLVPGLGHWTIGRRGKALLYFLVVSSCFVTGVLLADGTNLSWEKDRIFFFAYAWNGGQTLLGWVLFGAVERSHPVTYLQMGYLYTSVAGLLNLVAIMDYEASVGRGLLPALPTVAGPGSASGPAEGPGPAADADPAADPDDRPADAGRAGAGEARP